MNEPLLIDPLQDTARTCRITCMSRSSLHTAINEGLIPRPIKVALGGQKNGWFLSELRAFNMARAQGADKVALRKLAQQLEAKRFAELAV